VSHNVTYLQGSRQRVEFPGVVSLDQCDLDRTVILNLPAKRYYVQPYSGGAAAAAPAQQAAMPTAGQPGQPRGGVVTLTTTISDTLERQTIHGLEARHIKTVLLKQASANACDKSPMKVEVDAWYVDLPQQSACVRPSAAPAPTPDPSLCTDRVETRVVGDAKLGFPVRSVTTTTGGEGDKVDVSTSQLEVSELEISRLDKMLFEVPADFVEAKSSAEIIPAIATGESLADAIYGSTADGSSDAAPKKPGAIRIGVLEPVNKTDRILPPSRLRQDLVTRLSKAPYEAVTLKGNSPSAILDDARRLECDYVMLAEVIEAKTSKPGRLGGVMKLAGGGSAKDSQDAKVDYKLFAVTAPESPRVSGSSKASSGGVGIGSMLRVASFAGQMYMGMMMGGGMGFGVGGPMGMLTGLGASGGGIFDPRAMAISSVAAGMSASAMSAMGSMSGLAGFADPSETEMRQTVSDALGQAAKGAMEQLSKRK
jgi:hypothetical protein